VAGINHVSNSTITYSTSPSDGGLDLSSFAGTNALTANLPMFKWQPWGMKRGGVMRPDAKIYIATANRSGASASYFIHLMVQANPCGENALYSTDKKGVYGRSERQSRAFFKSLMNLSFFPVSNG
jgi:hypothetical protein